LPSNRFYEVLSRGKPWFFLEYPHDGVWAASRDEIPEIPMAKIETEKCMISIIWSISGIHSLFALTKGMKYKYNFQSFCQHVFLDIQQNICSLSRRKALNDIILHLSNASAHNSRLSSEIIEFAKVQRLPHPHYSSDQAPSDFFLFGFLKEQFRET
jgi:hypothetical protein